jgi:predicted Ser/Thr protein kinase
MLNKKDLELLTVAQLKEYAKDLGITKKLTLKSEFIKEMLSVFRKNRKSRVLGKQKVINKSVKKQKSEKDVNPSGKKQIKSRKINKKPKTVVKDLDLKDANVTDVQNVADEPNQLKGLLKKYQSDIDRSITPENKITKSRKLSKNKKYQIINQLGDKGKEGTTYHVKNPKGEDYAMKTFNPNKSITNLQNEGNLLKIAGENEISPKVIEIDETNKYIIMEKCDSNLFDLLKQTNGVISEYVQDEILKIIKNLDKIGIFHGDPNPLNFMFKKGKLCIIDFGFAKKIDDNLIKNYNGEKKLNKKFMILGFMLKVKDLFKERNPDLQFSVLREHISPKDQDFFKL